MLKTHFELLLLSDGRELAYVEFGDPSGFPIFYLHGTPSSRLEGSLAETAAKKHQFRLLAIDRPGFGHSTFQSKRTFLDCPKDILELANHLSIDAFGVAGHSGAGPHLFACGATINPVRLKFIGALSPWGPIASPEINKQLNPVDAFYQKVASKAPWIMHIVFAPLAWGLRYAPSIFWWLVKTSISKPDTAFLNNTYFLELFRAIELEALRQGVKGAAHEALIAYQPWGFSLSDIRVPTYVWSGEDDVFVSNAMRTHIEKSIPSVEFQIVSNKGHFNIENWDDIFSSCRRHI